MKSRVVYREVQRLTQFWIWLIVAGVAILMWIGFVQQIILGKPFGDKPMPDAMLIVSWMLFGIIFPAVMFGLVKLIVEVRDQGENSGIYVKFLPFHPKYRTFSLREITRHEPIAYNALQRFGGWGVRINLKGETAYNMKGNQGIELVVNGKTVVIGTQRPEAFKRALDEVMSQQSKQ